MTRFSAVLLFLLGACAVKPADVDPPQGADRDYFPRTYPAPSPAPAQAERYIPR